MKIYTTKMFERISAATRCCITLKAKSLKDKGRYGGWLIVPKYVDGGGVVEKDGTLRNYYRLRLSRFLVSLFRRDLFLRPAPWNGCCIFCCRCTTIIRLGNFSEDLETLMENVSNQITCIITGPITSCSFIFISTYV